MIKNGIPHNVNNLELFKHNAYGNQIYGINEIYIVKIHIAVCTQKHKTDGRNKTCRKYNKALFHYGRHKANYHHVKKR